MELTREVTLPAPVEEVWEAVTEDLGGWFGYDVEWSLEPGGDACATDDPPLPPSAIFDRIL